MIESILKLHDKLIDRAERYFQDAIEREDWEDARYYRGQKEAIEEMKEIIENKFGL